MDLSSILKFLKSIAKNNNRDWFEKNKPKYIECKDTWDEFIAALLLELVKFDESLTGLEPKKLTFRIYRDVRFSKDKRPYKTNFAAGISSAGKGVGRPGYYLQLEPGNKSFACAGLFMPEPEMLRNVRQEIDYNGAHLEKIMKDKKFKKYYKEFWNDEKLKTAPKGYPKDHRHIEWLKLKSFIVLHEFTDAQVTDKKFLRSVVNALQAAKPLNDFLREAISE